MTEQYTPTEEQVRVAYMGDRITYDGLSGEEALGEWTAFLARVRRDAAREALAGMASAHTGAFMEEDRPTYRHEHNIAAQAADNYMCAHYPEEGR